jgi:hypothetical protein
MAGRQKNLDCRSLDSRAKMKESTKEKHGMIFKFLVSMVFLWNQFALAQGSKSSTEVPLNLLSYVVNSAKTVGTLLSTLQPFMTQEELQLSREFLTKNGVTENDVLPKVARNGNDLELGGLKVSLTEDGGAKYNGVIYRVGKQESFDQLVRRIHADLTGKDHVAMGVLGLLLSTAQAKEVHQKMTEASGTTVAAVGTALAAVLIGTAIFLSSPVVIAATLGTVVATSAVAFGIAAFASRNDSRLFCDGKKMMIKNGAAEARYDFTKGLGQPSLEVKNAKGITTKTDTFDGETAKAIGTLYTQGCVSKKSAVINLALERIQKGDFKKMLATGPGSQGAKGNR